MTELKKDVRSALAYIEAHITHELDIREIAKQACLSPFYFQRIFAALCGVGVGEYIRNRRLTLAGEELSRNNAKVIDIAAKYGYESPDSFNRAFQRFHGISPSAARRKGACLRAYGPVTIKQTLEGGNIMEYRIVEKPQFTVMGISRKFDPETSYQQIPEYWTEIMGKPDCPLMGMYGICMDPDGQDSEFDYWIADNYIPWQEIPAPCKPLVIPGGTWAVFPCKLKTLQDTNTKMWQEWLPGCREYKLSGSYNLEVYGPPCKEDPGESYVELWLPVIKI